ncbi:IPT/TIG domain-containing protein [Arthrobacter sp. ES3-54]|uniref:IPT/TIG domain-containing protein n=1 Tax=Arthrobacter sp. ES3-54 TaxID=1502991 RepID=UPI002404F82A|nr:IPT/TIG domain-containing protein [Arthrobacter sp. ES3-54]MDF9750291.1 hypothetical protein [Arthrobacter sp. ES3-54]
MSVTSSHPNRIANATFTVDEGSASATIDLFSGMQCGRAGLTFQAPGHAPTETFFLVAAAPHITAISPNSGTTCNGINLVLTGDCLGDSDTNPQATLMGPDGEYHATTTIRTPQTEVVLTHGPLPAGIYDIALSNCGRIDYGPVPLTIMHSPPIIAKPLTANVTSVLLCSTPAITLTWQVRAASMIRLFRGNVLVTERNYDPCQQVTDSVTDTVPLITAAGVSYTLGAFNPLGDVVTSGPLNIPAGSPAPSATSFFIINNSTEAVNAFLINGEDLGGAFLGTFAVGQSTVVTLPVCLIRGIASLSPRLVAEHNQNFPNRQVDAKAVATVRTSGTWSRNFSGYRLGQASSGTQGFSI